MRKFTLYWSSLEKYEKCPRMFLWSRGWEGIDVGGGLGRKKPLPYKRSKHHAVMGIVIQAVIERMYNDELYRDSGLRDRLLAMIRPEWDRVTAKKNNWVDYRVAGKKDELIAVCEAGVLGYLRTMQEHKFIGPWTKAEFELLGWIDKWNPVGGRPDVIFRRADTGITILDGKNSKSKGKYTDPDQLRFYAMCFYLAYRQMVDRLGFVYYRYPYGAPVLDKDGNPTGETETGVDWVDFTKDDLRGLAKRCVDARWAMNRKKFDPTPVPKHCRWCDYEEVCDARQDQIASNRRANPKAIDSVKGAGEFVDLEL